MHNLLMIPCTLKDETSLYIERGEKLKYDEEKTSLYTEREKKEIPHLTLQRRTIYKNIKK